MNNRVCIVCIAYNHGRFIRQALDSIIAQSYADIEVIVIDDASSDDSPDIIKEYLKKFPDWLFIRNENNLGLCRSFNIALSKTTCQYIIDFSADDIMRSDRLSKQVEAFQKLDNTYAVVFSDVMNISENGTELGRQYKPDEEVPSGDVYTSILEKYFISTPSMMMKRLVLEELGGYDEDLAYEDFDFWVRASRKYKFHFLRDALTFRRVVKGSFSSRFLDKRYASMQESTYKVCLKALWLSKNEKEYQMLGRRMRYEMQQAFILENAGIVRKYEEALKSFNQNSFYSACLVFVSKLPLPVNWIYKLYHRLRKRSKY